MTKYTYLMIDLLSVMLPILFTFHAKIRFYKHWNALLSSILITGLIFTLWDSWFVHLHVWGFNHIYITGVHLGNLPLEEILFFICIPYSCVFTFECIPIKKSPLYVKSKTRFISYSLAGILLILTIVFKSLFYTATAFALLSVLILFATIKKVVWLPKFYLVYSILLIPFLVVNGLLTGTFLSSPVVWYNPDGIIGIRILTIPLEDIFYGMSLILTNIWIYSNVKDKFRPPKIFKNHKNFGVENHK